MKLGVVTVSDSRTLETDASGSALVTLIIEAGWSVVMREIVRDEEIALVRVLSAVSHCDVVVTTGGTGLTPRDVTPQATKRVIEYEVPGLAAALTIHSLKKTPFAALSRAVVGVRQQTLIVNLPGSEKAVRECWEVLRPVLTHTVAQLRGVRDVVHQEMERGAASTVNTQNPATGCSCGSSVPSAPSSVSAVDGGRPRHSTWEMVSVDLAQRLIDAHLETLVPLFRTVNLITEGDYLELLGHRIAVDVKARVSIPRFPASIKDGYAVISADGAGSRQVVARSDAGDAPSTDLVLLPGQCAVVNTGAAIPPGADAVVQIEDTRLLSREDEREVEVEVLTVPVVGQDIRQPGSDVAEGSLILHAGHVINSAEVALLVSTGVQEVALNQGAELDILCTGSELVSAGSPLAPGHIYDSNGPMLRTLLQKYCRIRRQMIVADDLQGTIDAIRPVVAGRGVCVISGGVSMGDRDYVKEALLTLGGTIHFGRLNMKPGKPTTFCTFPSGTCVFALPGNPVSAWVTAHLFLIPFLRGAKGAKDTAWPRIRVKLNDSVKLDPRPEYARAQLDVTTSPPTATLIGSQMSSRLLSVSGTVALVELPGKSTNRSLVEKGEEVWALLILGS